MNNDQQIEKLYHPENFEDDSLRENLSDLIALISDAVADLDNYSMLNDDKFSTEISEFEEILEKCRKKI